MSPFRFSTPLHPDDARISRPHAEELIRSAAANSGRLAITGPARCGLTSLIHTSLGGAPSPLPYLLIPLRGLTSVTDFCLRSDLAIHRFLTEHKYVVLPERDSLRTALTTLLADPPIPNATGKALAAFSSAFGSLGAAVPRLSIVFDDFHEVLSIQPEGLARDLLDALRNSIPSHTTSYLFVGRPNPLLGYYFYKHLPGLSAPCEVEPFDTQALLDFITARFAEGGRMLKETGVRMLAISEADRDCGALMRLCYHTWAHSVPGEHIISRTLGEALHQLIDDQEARLDLILAKSTALQQRILFALTCHSQGRAHFQTAAFTQLVGANYRQATGKAVRSLLASQGASPFLSAEGSVVQFCDQWLSLAIVRRVLRQPWLLTLMGLPKASIPLWTRNLFQEWP